MAGWIGGYLTTQRKQDPIFRSGWQIDITGPKAQGMDDKGAQMGQAVLIEMKK